MTSITDRLEELTDAVDEARREASSLQQAIDELQGELDAQAAFIEEQADKAHELMVSLPRGGDEEDDYEEAERVWQDICDTLGDVKDGRA